MAGTLVGRDLDGNGANPLLRGLLREVIEDVDTADLNHRPGFELQTLVADDAWLTDKHDGVRRHQFGLVIRRGRRCKLALLGVRWLGRAAATCSVTPFHRSERDKGFVPNPLRFFQPVGVTEVLQQPDAEVVCAEAFLGGEPVACAPTACARCAVHCRGC